MAASNRCSFVAEESSCCVAWRALYSSSEITTTPSVFSAVNDEGFKALCNLIEVVVTIFSKVGEGSGNQNTQAVYKFMGVQNVALLQRNTDASLCRFSVIFALPNL